MIVKEVTARKIHHSFQRFVDNAINLSEARIGSFNGFVRHYRTRSPELGSNRHTLETSTCIEVF